jgi:hypothetical protein
LAFSGSFLLSLTVMHLLPEIYESKIHIGLFIMFVQIILGFLQGAELWLCWTRKMMRIPWLLFALALAFMRF